MYEKQRYCEGRPVDFVFEIEILDKAKNVAIRISKDLFRASLNHNKIV